MKFHSIIYVTLLIIFAAFSGMYSKTFLEIAKQEVEEEFKYDSPEYRNEPDSLNHLYYTQRGKEELEQCRNLYKANYDDCRNYKTCNFCSANSGCGWCDEKKICLPLDLNARKDELIPLCMGDCLKVLKIEFCYKGLFEPDNTKNEVNFANIDQVVNQSKYKKSPYDPIDLDNDTESAFDNILEKTLEKNILESQKVKPEFSYNFIQKRDNAKNESMNTSNNANSPAYEYSINNKSKLDLKSNNYNDINEDFMQKSLNLLETFSKAKAEAQKEESTNKLQSLSLHDDINRGIGPYSFSNNNNKIDIDNNNKNAKYNAYSNFKQSDEEIFKKGKENCDEAKDGVQGISQLKPVLNDPSLNFIPKSYTNYPNSIDLEKNSKQMYQDMAQISKEVFNSLLSKDLQSRKKNNFIKANLDDANPSQERILKNLKEFIPNFEFPQFIKSDLEQSINDIKREKLLLWLRGFKLNDEISKIHLPIYKNLSFTNEDQIRKMFLDKFYKDIVKDPYANVNSVIYKNMLGNSGKIISKKDVSKYLGKKPKDVIKDLAVVDSKFIDKKDLMNLVTQSNMRFKENDDKNNENNNKYTINDTGSNADKKDDKNKEKNGQINNVKSLKELTQELKNFLKKMI